MSTSPPDGLTGNFALAELPRILIAPCRAQLSGALWLEHGESARRIVYSNGWPIAAASNLADEQIEAHLLNGNHLSPPNLQKAISHAAKKKIDLQQALSELQLLSKTTFVDQLLELRKRIVTNALQGPCKTRFEPSAADPIGFSSLPLLECCTRAVSRWSPQDQQAVLAAVGNRALSVHTADAELAMTLGAPKTLLALMQSLTKEPKPASQVAANARTDLIAAVATRLVQPPQDMKPMDGPLDRELNDAIAKVQQTSRGDWEPILPAAVERRGLSPRLLAAAVAITALVSVGLTWTLARSPPPPSPSVEAPPPEPPPSSQPVMPSVLAVAADRVKQQSKPKLSEEDQARLEALLKRGNAWMKKKKADAAIKEYKLALEVDPSSAAAHRALGIAYTKTGEAEQAVFEFKLYLRLSPFADDADAVKDLIDNFEKRAR
ncbi:MAG: tetratricopeptide repeat protein [Deltaproteobacteria bacterium]|nr:tetratricopeptide repeat protein [Deltaproteobacteria bacterium]